MNSEATGNRGIRIPWTKISGKNGPVAEVKGLEIVGTMTVNVSNGRLQMLLIYGLTRTDALAGFATNAIVNSPEMMSAISKTMRIDYLVALYGLPGLTDGMRLGGA